MTSDHVLKTTSHHAILIRNGRIIDPANNRDEMADIAIADGVIANSASRDVHVIDAAGCIVCPGLWDIHVHLREPGQSHKETIETGTAAAAAGGFTFVACMPNTTPPLDSPEQIRWVRERAAKIDQCDVGVVACITKGRAGRELCDFAALKTAGAVALTDDGSGVDDDKVMALAFEEAARHGMILIQHCEYKSVSAGGVMHLGEVSKRLGLPGLDPRSEESMIERDIDLCRKTGARYHVAHISTSKAIDLVRRAKRNGLPVTAEVCTHHLILTDEACEATDPNTKMHPPLRPTQDVEACRQGLLDGTIDCIVTDHAPHSAEEKALGFLKAPAGIVGLETAIGIAAKAMIGSGLADWPQLIDWFSTAPRQVLGIASPAIDFGHRAELTIVHPNAEWTVHPQEFCSKSCNTPFACWNLRGRAIATIRGPLLHNRESQSAFR
ncbi:MAG: dihydroorotase [Planctomycetes bacterium]|nr:dihydroorotase [Planctomycetota bacterium]MBI3836186.1 dihydroorotase [Planctomycetota bacterium]